MNDQIEIILAKPVIYDARNYNKPNYYQSRAPSVVCDQCGLQNLDVYISNPQTPTFDLCYMCFNRAKALEAPTVGQPFNISQPSRQQPAPAAAPAACIMRMHANSRQDRSQDLDHAQSFFSSSGDNSER